MTDQEWLTANPFHFKFKSENLTIRLTVCECENLDHVLLTVEDGIAAPIKKAAVDMDVATGTVLTVGCALLASLGLEEVWELIYQLAKWRRKWQEGTGNFPVYLPKDAVVN